ncbi:hypothetical protein [Amycolatopsis kentuckyensis]|uniref:hypothetical protein n=1 Tax=Amycolatopsis kentuckyensis TaxID=218823 RepID=UPI000A3C6C80|nr:hypothetical protein [Amycolatopsis kentuckyensis]
MTIADDPVVAHIRQLHERFDREREEIRTRSVALGYSFGRIAERVARGDYDALDDDAGPFADFYEQHTDGSWADLSKKYDEFQSRKDTPK